MSLTLQLFLAKSISAQNLYITKSTKPLVKNYLKNGVN